MRRFRTRPAGRTHSRRRPVLVLAATATAAVLGVLAVPGPALAIDVRAGQWQLDALHIDRAQQLSRGSGVTVAVVDSGVDASHPDLSGQILSGTAIGGGKGGANDGRTDAAGHGTHMAGDIAAKGGGREHALGIAPGAKILPVRVFSTGTAEPSDIAAGIRWAVDHHARIVNVSLSANGTAPSGLVDAIGYAMRKGAVVVAGAGNLSNGQDGVGYPANVPGVVAVSGTTRGGAFWSGSVGGPPVALAAPADGVVSTGSKAAGNRTGYTRDEGTSDAAAFVSGAAALVWSKYPSLSAPDVIERLIRTADDAGPSGRDTQYGFGRLDVVKALTAKGIPHVGRNPLLAGGTGSGAATPDGGRTLVLKDRTGTYLTYGGIFCGVGVLVVVLVVVMVVVSGRRRRRRAQPPAGPPPGAFPDPGRPVPPYAPPPGYPGAPPPQHPPNPPH
ncbi:S8 family serine peptidase [Actinocatenispora rupis]|uniref:S8 family serine peptidase n=1 Tax=Actinocatenispora rupis TaxID=519421 RepID=UPI0019430106|nr:S8 family serine peptidase [Actinocatenispora rupis]